MPFIERTNPKYNLFIENEKGEALHLKLSNFTAREMLFYKASQRPFMRVGCQGASFGADLCKHHLSLFFYCIPNAV